VDVNPHDLGHWQLYFFENVADDAKYRAGFSGDIAENFEAVGEIGGYQSGKESVPIVDNDLTERCLRLGY